MTQKPPIAAVILSCGHPHTEDELRRALASFSQAKRLTRSGGRNGGRPRIPDRLRCPCREMSKKVAAKRGHKCEAPDAMELARREWKGGA